MATWDEIHKAIKVEEPHEIFVRFEKEYLKKGMRVLDLGCGTGRHALYCAKKGMEVHAVDISEAALDVLREETDKGGLFELLKVGQADMLDLPFPDSYFDAIICINVINHGYQKDVDAYFREATRVLRKGGIFFLIVTPPEFVEETKGKRTVEVEKGTFLYVDLPDGDIPHHVLDEKETREQLKGYDIIKIEKSKGRSHWKDIEVSRMEIIAKKR